VWGNYYHIREEQDLAFEFGLFFCGLELHDDALRLFQDSIRLYGDDPRTRWNMGLCHYGLSQPAEALRCFAGATALDPAFRPAGALQVKPGPE
jgi:tetratricopeptide (TPR) repeat protein